MLWNYANADSKLLSSRMMTPDRYTESEGEGCKGVSISTQAIIDNRRMTSQYPIQAVN